MAPYEALYGRPCKTHLCWTEAGERREFGPEIVEETMKKLEIIQTNMKKAPDRQKKYDDQSRREMVFSIVSAQKGKERFRKIGKLAVRFIGPYQIIQRIGEVAYRLNLPGEMQIHLVFHVSMLRKHVHDPNAIETEQIENLQTNLTYLEGPIRIGERRIRRLKNREIPQVQVFWGNRNRVVVTWEDESRFKALHLEFFHEDVVMEEGGSPSNTGRRM
ncbi:PREDICTED: uncharacterized protein LOC106297202 [Brassica oleracea var. oleracea]|uniref:uncharacterized protein LOC106297202 n=1 Tax=Brassica oleracea var. oleracea TaxID=109376 RepID=UPI0006A70C89|nr:PREDICTED: uncharacterized protein LOC106297202 [Brassica oleracea var. oleracea]